MPNEPQSDDIANLRRDYGLRQLREQDLHPDPIHQFQTWFAEAEQALIEPNAMTLSTCTPDGHPSARIVLLKGVDERGFVFYSNYTSRKGAELAANPRGAIVFYWAALERQVRVVGEVTQTSREESANYFRSRPRGSQLSASISNQSQPVTRERLEAEWKKLDTDYADVDIPVPENWGGYRLRPTEIEFWQGRESRLHDRIVYCKQGGAWSLQRLAP